MNRKSGELAIHNHAHEKAGSLFMISGELIHASMNGSSGLAAFDRILHLADGYFVFLAEQKTESRSIEMPIQVLLMEAHVRQDERLQLQSELPAAETVLTMASDVGSVPPLNTCEWKALSLINGRRTIARICQKFGDELGALRALHALIVKGLVAPMVLESPLFPLTPHPQSAAAVSEDRPYPPRLRTNLLLKAIDGRTSLKQLAASMKMDVPELIEDVRLLLELKWVLFNAKDEQIWSHYWQESH
jgi:hypothetical protein